MTRRDPVEAESDGSTDLYDVATWEPRSVLDRAAVVVYRIADITARLLVVLLALLILGAILLSGAAAATYTEDPRVAGLVLLSVVPALLLVGYIYVADVTTSEPLWLLVVTFVLGVIFASFAAVLNSVFSSITVIPVIGMILFFYLIVGPIEEGVKLLAVWLYAYRDERFDAVVDGAVYGAVAGLGFATIENALYIARGLTRTSEATTLGVGPVVAHGGGPEASLAAVGGLLAAVASQGGVENIINAGGQITAFRALAGPGHVIYSAFAGYYLGLAKFNRERAGPIVVKGLIIAALIHATYNVLVGIVPAVVNSAFPGVSQLTIFVVFVLIYDGIFFGLLLRKIRRYRKAYHAVGAGREAADFKAEATEFER